MIWVAWRQQRLQILISVGLVAIAAVVMVFVRAQAAGFLADHGAAGCWQQQYGCVSSGALDGLSQRFNQYVSNYPLVLLALPPLLGMFAGGPMFARDLEQGTHVFGLTQSIGRVRWWTTKALVGGVPVVVAMIGLGFINSWSLQPLRPVLTTRLMTPRFETEALVLGAYTLLAVVLGLTAGLWTRNTLAAMVITLGLYIGVLIVLGNGARPHYVPPLSVSAPVADGLDGQIIPEDAWRVDSTYVDTDGREVKFSAATCSLPAAKTQTAAVQTEQPRACLSEGRVARLVAWYQPDSRFWTLQLVEAGIVALLSTGSLGLAAWAVRRRLY